MGLPKWLWNPGSKEAKIATDKFGIMGAPPPDYRERIMKVFWNPSDQTPVYRPGSPSLPIVGNIFGPPRPVRRE